MECLLCASEKQHKFEHVVSFGYPLTYYQCDNCGLIFQSAEESRAADPDFYSETYRKIYQSSEEPTAKDVWVQENRAAYLVNFVRDHIQFSPERMLDIGASTGILLKSFARAFQSEITGVELGDAYRAFAGDKGVRMFPSIDALKLVDPVKYDLVSMIHVLEHLPDPVVSLKHIRHDLISENGLLLLEVPNFYAHDSYELAHLACFTAHTLREIVKQAGFRVVHLQCHGEPRSAILKLYITLLAQPLPKGIAPPRLQPDSLVNLKRQVGMLYRRFMQKLFPHKAWFPLPTEKDASN